MNNLARRIATAAVLVAVVLVMIYLDPTHWAVTGGTVVAAAIAGDEFLRMSVRRIEGTRESPASADSAASLEADASASKSGESASEGLLTLRVLFALSSTALILGCAIDHSGRWLMPLVLSGALLLAVGVLMHKKALRDGGAYLTSMLAGWIYVPVMLSVWPLIKREVGPNWLTVALATAFLSDTVAYFVGRAFGKTPLYPEVSPKKTVEGSVGGLLGGILAQVGMGSLWLVPHLPVWHAVILGILGSVLGQSGDLVESMIKRSCGVKDSGTLLPGHGGMLDRVDALLFVAPMAYVYVTLMGPEALTARPIPF